MIKRMPPTLPSRNRRGSVLILVVAVLAVLVLLTLTLSYMSRMDLLASRNWGNTVQSRMAAVTGVPDFKHGTVAAKPALATTAQQVTPVAQAGAVQNGVLTAQSLLNRNYGAQRPFPLDIALGQTGVAGSAPGGVDLANLYNQNLSALNQAALNLRGLNRGARGSAGPGRPGRPAGNASASGAYAASGPNTIAGAGTDETNTGTATTDASQQLAVALLEDTSAKININAITPDALVAAGTGEQAFNGQGGSLPVAAGTVTESALARLIQQVAAANQISAGNAPTLAHAIVAWRFGLDGEPGSAAANASANTATANATIITTQDPAQAASTADRVADAPGKTSSDPRHKPAGDDHLFINLQELMGLPGMTPALYKALTPYLTVFSVSLAAFQVDGNAAGQAPAHMRSDDGGNRRGEGRGGDDPAAGAQAGDALAGGSPSDGVATGLPQVDPNTASPSVVYAALQKRFPEADEDLLGQFVANMIDRCDADSVPTTIQIGSRSYTGIEINPCLNEICPAPSATGNQGGQFIEIINPWSKPLSLAGWSLRGTGVQAMLNTTLPSGGLLVLTNNINNDSNPTAEDNGMDGSFYNVFKKVATGDAHQLVEVQGMSLPADSGKVQLVNPRGMVVDEFEYAGGQNNGAAYSFQRLDPRLRVARRLLTPNPLETNQGATMTPEWTQAMQIMEQWQNQPFRSPLDVMLVSTAYATTAGSRDSAERQGRGGRGGRRGGHGGQAADTGNSTAEDPGQPAKAGDKTEKSRGGRRGGTDQQMQGQPFALPVMSDTSGENLDLRLVDCFRGGARLVAQGEPPLPGSTVAQAVGQDDPAAPQLAASQTATPQSATAGGAQTVTLPQPPDCETVQGRLNLNTAPVAVISTLPGMDSAILLKIAQQRSGLNGSVDAYGVATPPNSAGGAWTAWTAESPFDAPCWANLSDFLLDETLWDGRPLYDRLDAVYPFSQMVTFHTLSVRVVTASIPVPDTMHPDTLANAAAGQAATAAAGNVNAPGGNAGAIQAGRRGMTGNKVRLGAGMGLRDASGLGGAAGAGFTAVQATPTPLPGTRRTSIVQTERIIASDRGAPETVFFRYIGNYSEKQVDPDTRYAAAPGQVQPLDTVALAEKVRAAGGTTEDTPGSAASSAVSAAAPSAASGRVGGLR